MENLLNSEVFADWVSMSILGILLWVFGYLDRRKLCPISVPRWLIILTARIGENRQIAYLYSFTVQLLGFSLFMLATILSLAVTSHGQRVFWFKWGFVVSLLLAGLFVAFKRLVR